jgi:hypothetical protein
MGLWGVYSSFLVINAHTASTMKKGVQRIMGHIIVALFIFLYLTFLYYGFPSISILLMFFCFFILGYLIACGENMRYIGTAGGIGLGIMLLEHPLQQETLHVAVFRASIIIFSGAFGVLFDRLFFPVKTKDLLLSSVNEIFNTLIFVQNLILEKKYEKAIEKLNNLDPILIKSLEYSNDLSFHLIKLDVIIPSLKKVFFFQKELIFQYKDLLDSFSQREKNVYIENYEPVERKLLLLLSENLNRFAKGIVLENREELFKIMEDTLFIIRSDELFSELSHSEKVFFYGRLSKIVQMTENLSDLTNESLHPQPV